MPRPLSDSYLLAANSLAPEDSPLTALEITHPDLPAPIRVVNDSINQVIDGNEYIALRFGATLAADVDGQVPRARLVIDNVGRALTEPLEQVGGGAGASVRAMQVMRSNPSAIEWEMTLDIISVTIDQLQVTADIGFEPLLGRAAVITRHDPQNSPGLF